MQLQPYKVERDLVAGHDLSRLALPPSLPAALPHNLPHIEPYSSPRDQSSAGSCGTPDPRTPVTPRPASQQERYNLKKYLTQEQSCNALKGNYIRR